MLKKSSINAYICNSCVQGDEISFEEEDNNHLTDLLRGQILIPRFGHLANNGPSESLHST